MPSSHPAPAAEEIFDLLTEIGLDAETLAEADSSTRLRADLALSSVETTDLQLELTARFGLAVNLWDTEDYTLGQLAELAGAAVSR
ncbi:MULTISPECIES: hypothetical protein [Amycolatopsis]|uniref:Acyl carrier protein n=1 Tax=Amycolatopsis rubida TaxID=112413 RepID=A0A1I5IN27_9PSEU|nr:MULTISPECIES: hypothetical protein [Amycolatopsis]OAP20675.1 hypothetical protein A4R44_08528 [Amycolatopsis sp. M39]SFO62038.1 hypothetical protein SAMN05421854_102573 [Amycolatopsis rubida]